MSPAQELSHQGVRDLCDMATQLVSRLPNKPPRGSPRQIETSALRSTAGGGGRARAEILDLIPGDAVVMTANLTLLVEGVADCLQVASSRGNAVNAPAMTAVLRPAVEVAGQLAWLLDDKIAGDERCRRYLIWRLHDLRNQRHLLSEFRTGSDPQGLAQEELDAIEHKLLRLTATAKWNARPTVVKANGDREGAALLQTVGKKAEGMPKITALVRTIASTPSLYTLLSVAIHGQRFGVFHGLEQVGEPDRFGKVDAAMKGFALPPSTGISLACVALSTPSRLLAGWNGVDASSLQRMARRVSGLVGSG